MTWSLGDGKSRRIAREAARWRAEMEEPSSTGQVEAFEAWLKADPAHVAAYRESSAIAEAGTRLFSRSHYLQQSASVVRRYRPAFAMAAMAALVAGLWGLIRDPAPAYAAITNRGQAIRVVALRDGSIVTLDTGTTLDVAIDPGTHHVKMSSGRARFVVHLPPGQLLRLTASTGEVFAGNGTFDVAVAKESVWIWVIDGKAELSSSAVSGSSTPLSLIAGKGAQMTIGGAGATPIKLPDTTWPSAHVAYDQAPLASILVVANRDGLPKITVADDTIGAMRVTGVLDLRDTRTLARKLAVALDLRLVERDGTLQLGRKQN